MSTADNSDEIKFATPLDAYNASLVVANAQAQAYANGYHAGMTRAAEICRAQDSFDYDDPGESYSAAILKARDGV